MDATNRHSDAGDLLPSLSFEEECLRALLFCFPALHATRFRRR